MGLFVCDSDRFMFMLDSRAYLMWFVLVCGSPLYFVRVRFGLRTVLSFDTCWLENVSGTIHDTYTIPSFYYRVTKCIFDTLSHSVILHTFFVTW